MILVQQLRLGEGTGAWFTGRDSTTPRPLVGDPGNLAHRRPHRPSDLARDRSEVGQTIGYPPGRWHLMHQVHGADVAVVDDRTPIGAELRDVDAAVTSALDRPLVVQVADCVPVLFAGPSTVGVAHAGRKGVYHGVVGATLERLTELGDEPDVLAAAIGPAIRGCCYEVPEQLQAEVVAQDPAAQARTTWGTPSLDLPAAVRAQLEAAGVREVQDLDVCTCCDDRWFSHRRDPDGGRQVGIAVRPSPAGGESDTAEGAP